MAAPQIIAQREANAFKSIFSLLRKITAKVGSPYNEPNCLPAHGRDYNGLIRIEAVASLLTQIEPKVNDTADVAKVTKENAKLTKSLAELQKMYAEAVARADAAERKLKSLKEVIA